MSATEMLCPEGDGLTHHLVPDGREMRCAYCSSTQAQIEAQNVPQRLREHCVSCGRASAFITPAGACLKCQGGPEPVRFEPPLTRAEADAFWNAITDQTESPDQDQQDRSQ